MNSSSNNNNNNYYDYYNSVSIVVVVVVVVVARTAAATAAAAWSTGERESIAGHTTTLPLLLLQYLRERQFILHNHKCIITKQLLDNTGGWPVGYFDVVER